MKKTSIRKIFAAVAALSSFYAPTLAAQTQAAPLLVDSDWLASHLKDRGMVLLHVGSGQEPTAKAEYDAGHLPGARFISLEDVSLPMKPGALILELPPVEDLRAKLSSFGISDDSQIVVYIGKKGTFQSATRIVFTLDYMGLRNRTSFLNGGATAWTGSGRTLTTEAPLITSGKLTAKPQQDLLADAALVQSINQQPNLKLVDARTPINPAGAWQSAYPK